MTSTIQQQEKEFQKAIQPGSPISALLSSARQPLVMGVSGEPMSPNPNHPKESALLRKLQAAKESPLRRNYMNANGDDEYIGEEDRKARKELEAQKARIVAQMAPVREEPELEEEEEELNPVAPAEKYAHLTEKLGLASASVKSKSPSTSPEIQHAPVPAALLARRPLPQIPGQKERGERPALVTSRTRENLPSLMASAAFGGSTTTLPRVESGTLKGKGKERVVGSTGVRIGEKENVPTSGSGLSLLQKRGTLTNSLLPILSAPTRIRSNN